MMKPVNRIDGIGANAITGNVVIDFPKAIWNLGMIFLATTLAPLYFNFGAFFLFVLLTYLSLLIGHSAGMHRLMIHSTYECEPWLERLLIYLGVLVGLSGPFGIIRMHDLRDWAQRQENCHSFFSHEKSYFIDIWWQLTSKFIFDAPPRINIEPKYSDDRFYVFLEKTWRWHQLVLAVILFVLGGLPFLIWGIFVRVAVSVVGHWTITYFCHNPGPGRWRVKNAAVQASNLPGLGLITYGECWHNNHHAFPESARIGLEKGQSDPAWRFIQILNTFGLARKIGVPRSDDSREDLYDIDQMN